MEVEEDVAANVRINLPRNKSKNRQRLNNIHHLTRAAERGGLEGQAALGAKKRGAPKSGGREKKNRN
jgi:hypothetical protein